MAVPLGMFSTRPTRPMTFNGSLSRAMASIAPTTVAAPDMSHFMLNMPSLGLSDRPPESNVTPLPTKAMGSWSFGPPRCSKITSRGGRSEPLATASSEPQRSASSRD